MRYLIHLMIIAALMIGAGCVFRSGEDTATDPGTSPGGAEATAADTATETDSEGRILLNELPEGVDPDEVLRIKVGRSDLDGSGDDAGGDEYTAPAGAEDVTGPVAKNLDAEVIEIRPFDDPENPYFGQYTEFDRWHYDNFDPGAPFMLSGTPDERPGQLVVTDDGWAEPYLVTMRKALEFETGADVDVSHITKDFKLYARGVVSDELDAEVSNARARLTAGFAPEIPGWLAKEPPLWALILPDGHVATVGKLGSGRGFIPETGNWASESGAPACHYDPDGRLLDVLEPGEPWFMMFFPDLDAALAKHQVQPANVKSFNRYIVFENPADRELTGLYLYDGTELSREEQAEVRDVSRHFEMFGKYIPVMYGAQQDWGGEGGEG